jgi:hypothetical protein
MDIHRQRRPEGEESLTEWPQSERIRTHVEENQVQRKRFPQREEQPRKPPARTTEADKRRNSPTAISVPLIPEGASPSRLRVDQCPISHRNRICLSPAPPPATTTAPAFVLWHRHDRGQTWSDVATTGNEGELMAELRDLPTGEAVCSPTSRRCGDTVELIERLFGTTIPVVENARGDGWT